MRETDGVVGEFRIAEYVILATAPDAAVAVLVAGEILEDCYHSRAVRVCGVFTGHMRVAGQAERVVLIDVPVEHEPDEVGVGHVAPEFPNRRSARPGVETGFCAEELAVRMLRQG